MFDFLVALYNVGADYHSGQWSKGYRLMCQSARYLRREFGHDPNLDDGLNHEQQKLYFKLAETYGKWL